MMPIQPLGYTWQDYVDRVLPQEIVKAVIQLRQRYWDWRSDHRPFTDEDAKTMSVELVNMFKDLSSNGTDTLDTQVKMGYLLTTSNEKSSCIGYIAKIGPWYIDPVFDRHRMDNPNIDIYRPQAFSDIPSMHVISDMLVGMSANHASNEDVKFVLDYARKVIDAWEEGPAGLAWLSMIAYSDEGYEYEQRFENLRDVYGRAERIPNPPRDNWKGAEMELFWMSQVVPPYAVEFRPFYQIGPVRTPINARDYEEVAA